MSNPVFSSLEECFSDLPDPRVQGRCDHKLIDMIIITVCAVICGADSWSGVETFGKLSSNGSSNTWNYQTGYHHMIHWVASLLI